MVPRRLLRSLAGSAVVTALIGCNAVVGNEDITYVEGETTPGDENPEEPPGGEPDAGADAGPRDGGSDAKDADLDGPDDATDGGVCDAGDC